MKCEIVKDLLPLYVDGCCSEESREEVRKHIEECEICKKALEDMSSEILPSERECLQEKKLKRISNWKASLLQSALLFVSFGVITVGVAFEAATPNGLGNGFWALNIVVPATGFMLSLANWYFIRLYKSKRAFTNFSTLITVALTVAAFVWSLFHYEGFSGDILIAPIDLLEMIFGFLGLGVFATIVFCAASKICSGLYAAWLGKE